MRARTHFEDIKGSNDRQAIIVDELPYQANKRSLLAEKIEELVNDKRIEGINTCATSRISPACAW